jgi:hypothetical protein
VLSIRLLLIVAALVVAACAPPAATGEFRNPNLITREEIVTTQAANAHDAISRLRPAMLRSRGRVTINAGASGYPLVYLDGQRYGEIEILKSVPVEHISQIRFLSASDATTRFGTGHTSGVIEILTR